MAVTTILAVPVIALYLFAQRYFGKAPGLRE
jgi:ABC-type glycerol-3-phosphate transport system permease component